MTAEELIVLAKEIGADNLDKLTQTLARVYYRGYGDAMDYAIKTTQTN